MKNLFFLVVAAVAAVGFNTTASAAAHGDSTIITLSDKVPVEVMTAFESTFVFDDEGYFIGAKTSMLRPYLNRSEILDLVQPHLGAKDIVYEGYKPKSPRGFKRNNRWIGVARNIDIVIHADRETN